MHQLRLFLVAVQFFTRVPITGRLAQWMGFEPEWISRATRYFPLVGLIIGAACALLYYALAMLLPQSVAVALVMVFSIMATGAFHEDGFADFCDGFGGGNSPARVLEIMRDSRVGAYGAIGIMQMLLVKFELLSNIKPQWMILAIICSHVFSRACAVIVMSTLDYVELDLANKTAPAIKPVARHLITTDKIIATVFSLTPLVLFAYAFKAWPVVAFASLCALIACLWIRGKIKKNLGGYTGDTLGATQQLCEAFFLLGLLAMTHS
jgi:adenosylcobinamide-GDP ribazoletransferase